MNRVGRLSHRVVFLLLLVGGLLLAGFPVLPVYAGEEYDFVQAVESAPDRMEKFPQNRQTRVLLRRYKPIVYVAPGSYLPISFYRDYLPHCVLRKNGGAILKQNVDRSTLERVHRRPGVHLDYQITPDRALSYTREEVRPTLYGRVYGDTLTLDRKRVRLLFLKYSPVFPFSGLAAVMSWWKKAASYLVGDPMAWHELDIHGAVHVILRRRDHRPLGVLMAQHNHHRVRWRSLDFSWPENDRPRVAFAQYSNEPYLLASEPGPRRVRTVGNPTDIPYLFGRTDWAPLAAGYDRVVPPASGARRIPTRLRQLPPEDPLYRSHISLGDRKKILGIWDSWFREGPPGMDYYAHPRLKNLADLTAFWNIDPDDDRFFDLYANQERTLKNFKVEPLLEHQKRKTMRDLQTILPQVEQ